MKLDEEGRRRGRRLRRIVGLLLLFAGTGILWEAITFFRNVQIASVAVMLIGTACLISGAFNLIEAGPRSY